MSARRPRTDLRAALGRLSRRSTLLGLLVAALGAAALAVVSVSSNGVPLPNRYEFAVDVPGRTPPLKVSDPVRIAGKPAGKIVALTPGPDRVRVRVALDGDAAPLGRDARVRVRVVLGTSLAFLAVEPGDRADPLPSGDVLPGAPVSVGSSLPQALEVFDRETRAAVATNVVATAVAANGRGHAGNAGIADLRALSETAPPQLRAVVRDPSAVRRAVGDAAPVARALSGARADDVAQGISDADVLLSSAARVRHQLRASITRAADAQQRLITMANRFDASGRATVAMLEQAQPALRATVEQAPSGIRAMRAIRSLRQPLDDLAEVAPPTLTALRRSLPRLSHPAGSVQPLLAALVSFAQAVGPYNEDFAVASGFVASTADNQFGGERAVRVSVSVGCHAHVNLRPLPGTAHLDRTPC